MKFTKTDMPDGGVAFTLELTPEDMKKQYSYITQMIIRHAFEKGSTASMLLALEAMASEIEEENNDLKEELRRLKHED